MPELDLRTKPATELAEHGRHGKTGHTTKHGIRACVDYLLAKVQTFNPLGAGKAITGKRLMQKIEEQGYRCPLTGRKLTPETASLDHIVPLKLDGAHDMSNVHIVDAEVNAAKGVMSIEAFVTLCHDVVRHLESK